MDLEETEGEGEEEEAAEEAPQTTSKTAASDDKQSLASEAAVDSLMSVFYGAFHLDSGRGE